MADKIEVTSPVTIESDSKERVALELLKIIDSYSNIKGDQKDKKYWLTLYSQCYKATKGHALEGILKEQ